jgi:uroporphyrinogen decarboxylase
VNSKELVLATLRGSPVVRVPTGPLAVHFCAGVGGFTLRQYTTDPSALARSVIRYYERFKPDAVWISADTWVSAEAMGARVGATDDGQPFGGTGEPLVRTIRHIDALPAPNVGVQGRYPLMLEALSRVVDALGNDVFIVACFDQYPFSLATALMGVKEIMLKVRDDPPFVEALMDRCEEHALAYARALADAGADMLSGGDSPAGLLGPRLYREIALVRERRLISRLKVATAKPLSLHICGDATAVLGSMQTSGADVLELDHAVGISEACRVLDPATVLWGNLDPVAVLSRGTPENVRDRVRDVLSGIAAHGRRRFVLSSGCTLAVETPHCNLDAFFQAAGMSQPQGYIDQLASSPTK